MFAGGGTAVNVFGGCGPGSWAGGGVAGGFGLKGLVVVRRGGDRERERGGRFSVACSFFFSFSFSFSFCRRSPPSRRAQVSGLSVWESEPDSGCWGSTRSSPSSSSDSDSCSPCSFIQIRHQAAAQLLSGASESVRGHGEP